MTLPLAALSIVCSVALYTGGEYFSKLWGLDPGIPLMAAAMACYIASAFVWFPALLYRDQLSTIGIAWEVLALCATLLLGFLVFRENISAKNWLGLILGLIAAWLLLA